MIHHHSTLAEVKRTCRLIASTDENYAKYNEEKKKAEVEGGAWEMVSDYGEFSIYANDRYYITLHQSGAILRLYKSIR